MISVVPWDEAGHYVRFSLTFFAPSVEDEKQVVEEAARRLQDCEFIFEE